MCISKKPKELQTWGVCSHIFVLSSPRLQPKPEEEEKEGEAIMEPDHPHRPWLELPIELLHLILQHLHFIDYAGFGAVCKLWKSLTADTPQNSTLFSPIWNQHIHRNSIRNGHYVGSSNSCLIFMQQSDDVARLFNPWTDWTIMLPHFTPPPRNGIDFTRLFSCLALLYRAMHWARYVRT